MSKGLKQVAMLFAATFLGAVLNFIASKINTDVLNTAEYGNVRFVMNIIQLLSWIVLFGWFMSGSRLLALSNDRKRSARIRGALIVFLSVAVLLLMLLTFAVGMCYKGRPELQLLFFCSLPVCLYPLLTNYMNTTAQGDNHIVRLSLARVLPVLCFIIVALLLYPRLAVIDSKTVLYLHWGICSLVLIGIIISTRPSFGNLKPIFADLRKENKEYGIQLYWGSLAMVATNYLSGVTLGLFNSDNVNVGFFTLALSLAQPISYLPGIVGTTFFKQFVHEDRIPSKVFLLTIAMTILSCFVFILLIGPVVSLYDSSYAAVGPFAKWLAIGFSVHGIGDMINRFLGSHGQGRDIRNSSFACGAVKIIGSVLFVWLWNVQGAILTVLLSSSVYAISLYSRYCFYLKRTTFVSDK
ncbi:MAG: oligosaccharide flippase family protein [Bacteroidaceae bacterium]|nr:oligosaccharide flippase family protein [Bacteroidaceae bacterium]